ncbi:hypothetical protein FRC09_000388 [Ceratobasidium sp. 395]|nr:hypothetical protein FRC09_000388 [Ceratobasidium sp. 395]
MAGVGYYHCASSALGRGLGRATRDADLDSLVDDVGVIPMRHRTSNMSSTSAHPPETPTRPSTASSRNLLTPNVAAGYSRKTMVDFEHDRYLGLPDSKEYKDLGKVDLVKYWNIQASLPLLRAISKDVLPAQATSIRVDTVEKLQILKHTLRHGQPTSRAARADADLDDETTLGQSLDIMRQLGDGDWGYEAILDVN